MAAIERILITGATGTVGYPIAARLAAEGVTVVALVRDVVRARELLPEVIDLVKGDVTDAASVREAVDGCSVVYHASGIPEQWRLDPADFTRVNVDGTRNMVRAALETGVERFVYTSTIDVFAWRPGERFDESALDPDPRPTYYERSKQEADRIVTAALDEGLPAVFLHPSGVYGPAPVVAMGANDFFHRLALGKIPLLLPGGFPVVFAHDVAAGHIAAAERAEVGSRFILSSDYHTLEELAKALAALAGSKVPRVMGIPVARVVSRVGERVARVTKRPPLIPAGQLYFLESHAVPDASCARNELGWTAIGLAEGLERTLADFRAKGWL